MQILAACLRASLLHVIEEMHWLVGCEISILGTGKKRMR